MCLVELNRHRNERPEWTDLVVEALSRGDHRLLHRSLLQYDPTPLISLESLSERLGVGRVLVKDESLRFNLNAFKALGASYSIYRYVARRLVSRGKTEPPPQDFYNRTGLIEPNSLTFCTATDGNHGRAVAWAAGRLNQRAEIFVPDNTSRARIAAVKEEGATVHVVDGSYDDAVRAAREACDANGWVMIADTAWEGYTEIPRWVMAGYLTLFEEIHEVTTADRVDVVFLPVGVGSLAAAAAWYYHQVYSLPTPKLVLVEPLAADCFRRSLASIGGNAVSSPGGEDTIMAGLNCPTLSTIAWPILKQTAYAAVAVSDDWARKAMRTYYRPGGHDRRIISGESGASGLAALLALCEKEAFFEARAALGLKRDATVLLLNTEGDTDQYSFRKIVRGERRT